MDCRKYRAQFSDYLDGGLPTGERRALQAHLKACLPCYRSWCSFQRSVGALRRLPSIEPPEHLTSLTIARLNDRCPRPHLRLFDGIRGWMTLGAGITTLLVLCLIVWWRSPLPAPWSSRTNPGKARSQRPQTIAPRSTSPQVVVLKVQDVDRADRELSTLLKTFATPMMPKRQPDPAVRSRAARLIQVRVPPRHYPHLVRELVKIGYLDGPQDFNEQMTLGGHPEHDPVGVDIVVITDPHSQPGSSSPDLEKIRQITDSGS